MVNKKTLGKYGGNHYGRGLDGSRKKKQKQRGGEENTTIYIRRVEGNEDEYIYPIIKNIFPNKKIEFSNSRESYDLNIYSQYDSIPSNSSVPYIYTCGERWDKIIQKQTFVDQKCIANILTTEEVEKVNNYYYIPFFLNVGPKIYNNSPFVREYDSSNRNKLAVYLATHSPEHRDRFFKALHALDTTVDALGSANNTVKTDIPSRKDWWESPEIFKDYKFGFAMENKDEDGYITEKIMNVYRGGAIPLYWGTSKVKEIFHSDSFIYLNDYPSLEDAAKDVVAISKDENRMKKMFNAQIFKEDINPDYSKYYDTPSPQWVIDIANEIKSRLEQTGGNKYKKKGGDKKILIVKLKAGLGNRLFQILTGYGFAEKWNMNLKVIDMGSNHVPEEESKSNIKQLFPDIEFLDNSTDLSTYKSLGEKEEFVYHDIENPNSNATLEGFFQTEKYFPKKLPEINLVEPINNLIKDIDKEKLFFIHFRLGDYTGNKNVNYFSNNTITNYYRHCINKIKEKYPDAIFIIISNNTVETRKFIEKELSDNLSGNQLNYADDSNSKRLDSLYYMSKCKGGIAVNSTFSWFGTFFIRNNDKNFIFVVKPWFSRFDSNKQYDIYPSWATLVDVNIKSGGYETKSKAYVINLDERTDRWENIQRYFKDSSIQLERVSGIRNKNGHLGCGLSIQKVVKMAKDNSMDTVLIFEDDNKPLENFDQRWQTTKEWLDANMDKWDIFIASGKIEDWVPDNNIVLKYKLDNNVNLFEGSYVLNMNWIYVNKSVYDKILSWNISVVWAIDRYTGDSKYMKNLFIYPFLSLQDNGMSNTNSFDKNYTDENKRRIDRMDRLLKQQKGGKRKRKTKKLKKKKGGNNKYTAIIVEPRKHKALEFVVKNILENLDDRWNIIIFHGNLNKEYVENIINTSLEKYKNRISLTSLNKDNLSLADYNAVLTSKEFYDKIPTEMFLVFQTDSMINPKNKEKIYDFMQYDYVGAPWVDEQNPLKGDVGNGGFSLRRKSKMLEIIDKVPYSTFAEDVYFASPPPTIQINKPTIGQTQKFSSDEAWDKDSFGVHKVWVHVDNSILINDFPEIKTLIDLQAIQEGGDTPIDIVITFHSKDAKILPYSLKGLENINKGNIYLITNEDPKIENTIFIDEKLFPFKKDDLIEYIGEENGHRAGWYYQQLLKLYSFKIVTNLTENYLVVDSETVFLNPVKFVDENKLLFATGKEIHKPYFNHMNCLFNGTLKMKYPDKSGIVHHMVFNKNYLQEMFDKIQNLNNNEPWKAFMKCVNRKDAGLSGMSEYEVFFNYMLEYKSDNAIIRELRWANVQDVPNYSNYNSIDELLTECKKNYDCITLHEMFFRGTKMNLDQKGGNNNKKLIIKPHLPAGFFSQFNKLITCLVDNPEVTEIEFDMKSGNKDSAFGFINEGEELFSKIFEKYDEQKPITETLVKESYENMNITMGNAIHYYNENRSKLKPYHDAYKKYIKIKPEIQKKIDEKIKVLREDGPEQIIGIFVRSHALANEQPNGKMPTQKNYKEIIDSIDKTKKTKYFICADNINDLEYYKKHYNPNYFTDIRRTDNTLNSEPHKKSFGSLKDLEDSFIEVALLAQCDILVHCISNMATAALYMNENQESKSIFVEFNE